MKFAAVVLDGDFNEVDTKEEAEVIANQYATSNNVKDIYIFEYGSDDLVSASWQLDHKGGQFQPSEDFIGQDVDSI